VVVAYFSLTPSYQTSTYKLFPGEDKLAHFLMYAMTAFLLGKYFSDKKRWKWISIFLLAAGYGYLMEILQEWMNLGRQFDIYDILANIFGSLSGTMLIYMLYKLKSKS